MKKNSKTNTKKVYGVALWSTGYLNGFGGAEKIVNDILNSVTLPNCKFYLFTNRSGSYQLRNEYFKALPKDVILYQNTFDNPLLFTKSYVLFSRKLFLYIKASIQFAGFLLRNRIHVLHLHFVNIDVLLIVIYRIIFSYKLILTFTGTELLLARSSIISRIKLKIALSFADEVTAVSNEICQSLSREYNYSSAIYIPNGVNDELLNLKFHKPSSKKNPSDFIFCGRLHSIKRVPFLLESLREFLIRTKENRLIIIGNGPQESLIKKVICHYNIDSYVSLLGGLHHDNVIQKIRNSTAVILASESEGCPLVVLEAMALGKVVIASNVGGLKDIISHGRDGLLFPKSEPTKLVENINMILNNPEKQIKLGKQARMKVSSRFRKSQMLNAYRKIYLEKIK